MKKTFIASAIALGLLVPTANAEAAEDSKQKLNFYLEEGINQGQAKKALFDKNDKHAKKMESAVIDGDVDLKVRTLKDKVNSVKMKTDAAYPIESVQKDKALKLKLRAQLQSGKKIYLYGEGFTMEKYQTLMGLDDLAVRTYPMNYLELLAKGDEPEDKPEMRIQSEGNYQVIGYTLDKHHTSQLYLGAIEIDGENGEIENPDIKPHMYLRSLLSDETRTVEKNEKRKGNPSPKSAMSKLNNIFMGNEISAGACSGSCYNAYDPASYDLQVHYQTSNYAQLAGIAYVDYNLWKRTDEKISNYDYFVLDDYIESRGYHDFLPRLTSIKHWLTSDNDSMESRSPAGDRSDDSISVSFPWGVSWSINNGNSIKVEDHSNIASDTAYWYAKQPFWGTQNPVLFRPGTEWKSYGEWAYIKGYHGFYYRQTDAYGAQKNADRMDYYTVSYQY